MLKTAFFSKLSKKSRKFQFAMDFTRKLSFLVFLLCILISLQNQDDIDTNNKFSSHDDKYCSLSDDESHYIFDVDSFPPLPMFATTSHVERKLQQQTGARESLKYDYYHQTCPQAERIIRSSVRDLFKKRPQIAPALLRLAFHDCFVEVIFLQFPKTICIIVSCSACALYISAFFGF